MDTYELVLMDFIVNASKCRAPAIHYLANYVIIMLHVVAFSTTKDLHALFEFGVCDVKHNSS